MYKLAVLKETFNVVNRKGFVSKAPGKFVRVCL